MFYGYTEDMAFRHKGGGRVGERLRLRITISLRVDKLLLFARTVLGAKSYSRELLVVQGVGYTTRDCSSRRSAARAARSRGVVQYSSECAAT